MAMKMVYGASKFDRHTLKKSDLNFITIKRFLNVFSGTANAGERSVLVMFGSINFVLALASLSMPSTMFDVDFDGLTEGSYKRSLKFQTTFEKYLKNSFLLVFIRSKDWKEHRNLALS